MYISKGEVSGTQEPLLSYCLNEPAKPEMTEQTYNETQQRILDSAAQCVTQWGIEKTNLNDIAKHAGVTRPTVYSYFTSKDDVIRTALLRSGYAFAARVQEHVGKYRKTEDRLIEAVMFALEQLPKEPYLSAITEPNLSSVIGSDALREKGQLICLNIFSEIFPDGSNEDLPEIAEFTTRLLLSLLMIKEPIPRTPAETRAFLKRRLLPALGL